MVGRNTQNQKKMTKTIVFISVAIHFVRYQYAIGKKLEEKGVKVRYVTYSKEAKNFLKKRNADATYIPDVIKNYRIKEPLNEVLRKIEEEYDVNTNLILFGDYDHWFMKREKAFKSMIRNFMFWEDYFKKNKVDMIIGGIERYAGIIPYAVSKKYNARYYYWTRAVIPNHFVLSEDQSGHWSILDKYWEKNKNRKLAHEERKKAQEIINDIIEKKRSLYLVVGVPKITIGQILFFFKRLWLNIFVEKFRNPYARVIGIAWDKAMKAIRKYLAIPLYSKPDYNEKYFFQPLHVENDAQILVRAPQYFNQFALISYVAKCLPAGYKLYIEEHPNNRGGMPIKALRKLKNIPNVRLLHPSTHGHDVIKNASCITTINNTIGWESLLYKKPVINFGPCFYETSGLTYQVRNLAKLPETIKEALKKREFDEERLLRFVNAVLKSVYPGNFYFYYQYAKKAMVDENIGLIAAGVYKELNK